MTSHKSVGGSALACVIAAIAWSPSSAEQVSAINIPAQPLAGAIAELGSETGLRIAADAETLDGKQSNAVQGTMTPTEALQGLLQGTGLTVRPLNENSAIVAQNIVSQGQIEGAFDLGTLVLRGERVERDVFNTASSVRAYGGEEIEQNVQNQDFERVISDAANISTIGNSNQTPFIRGQSSAGPVTGAGAGITGQLPRANLTVDGRVQSFNELAYSPTSVWDVEAIEVFRGPQTTSQGANSIAGAFNIRTRDPVFEREFSARAQAGSDSKYVASFVANTPLSDSVAVRFSFDYQEEEPYINYPLGRPPNTKTDATEQLTARLKLLWEPVDIPELSTKVTLSYTDFQRPQTQNVTAPFEDLNSNNLDGFPPAFFGDTTAIIHDLEYELGGGFSVRNQLTYSQSESTRFTGNPTAFVPDLPLDQDSWSNELIFDYQRPDGNLSGIAGIFVTRSDEASDPGSLLVYDDEKEGIGVFTEATYRFANGFDLTGGIRYQRNDQDRLVQATFPPIDLDYSGSFDAWLPKLAVGYEPREDLRFTFQISKGFNPGGVGGSLGAILGGIPIADPFFEFDEETVTNFEFGMRGRFADGRLFVAANLFYADYEDYQFFIPTLLPGGFVDGIVSNAEGVESYGLEIDAQYQITDDLLLIGSLGLLNTEVTEFSTSAVPVTGNDMPFAPAVTFSLGVDYFVTDRFTVGGQIRFSDGYYSDIENSEAAEIDDITTVDLRAAYMITDNAEVYGYVNNAFDVVEPVQLFAGGMQGVTTKPREIGFGVRATW